MSDGYVEELLVNIDPKNYHLEYSILKSSFPLDGYSAEIKLIPVTQDNRTLYNGTCPLQQHIHPQRLLLLKSK